MIRPRFAYRSVELTVRLDTFLVCAVAAVLGNRAFLIITGYPQLGNGTLHISHAIWGALMMAIAVVIAVSYLPPSTRGFVAFLGGAGFGWFIDELGKFITRDANYFFQPTIALIYIVFVLFYLVFRVLERRDFGPDEAVLNALESLQAAAIGELGEPERRRSLDLLDATRPEGELASSVRMLLDRVSSLPPPNPGGLARAGESMRATYRRFTVQPAFSQALGGAFIVIIAWKVIDLVELMADGTLQPFAESVTVGSGLVAAALMAVGLAMLPRSRLKAIRWLERGLLVEILVTQVFIFAERQLAGLLGLAISLTLWVLVRTAIRVESERELGDENTASGSVNSTV